MAKAAKKHKTLRASSTEQQADDQISVHDAGTMLLKHCGKIYEARESLDSGIRRGVVQLLANGTPIRPDFFATHLYIEVTPDGRFDIDMTRAVVPCVYAISRASIIEFIDLGKPAVPALTDNAETTLSRNKRGPKVKFNWDLLVMELFRYVYENGSPPASNRKLADILLSRCSAYVKDLPESDTIERKLRVWLSRYPRGH